MMEDKSGMNHRNDEHFLSEAQMENMFVNGKKPAMAGHVCFEKSSDKAKIEKWFKQNNDNPRLIPHHEPIDGPQGKYDCNRLVDKWMEWSYTLPGRVSPILMPGEGYGGSTETENVHLFKSGKARIYFAAISPFRNPDVSRFVITKRYPILVPAYYAVASRQELPELKTVDELNTVVHKDLCGLKELVATIDDEDIWGCSVLRTNVLKIKNVPRDNILRIPGDRLAKYDNTIDIVHGGLWMLLDTSKNPRRGAEEFTNGDHLLYIKAKSVNYELEAKVQISAMFEPN